jgi:CBS domain-containing membrane protein
MHATTTKPFLALTAADLMTTPVLTIPQDTPLREAARLLHRSGISGAPVVDHHGCCIGVLSSSDFVTWAEEAGEATSFIALWGEVISVGDSPEEIIHNYMTARPVTIAPTAPIGDVAQKMVVAHIHRLLVVDRDRPCGIITSTDILAAVTHAARTAPQESERKPQRKSRARR